jgi:hypothetical protein
MERAKPQGMNRRVRKRMVFPKLHKPAGEWTRLGAVHARERTPEGGKGR